MTAFFVTGSGTDIGKTWACAQLLRHWRGRGLEPEGLKPVATGYDPARPEDSDAAELLKALGHPVTHRDVTGICFAMFRAPLSPDQAAKREGAWLSARSIAILCQNRIAAAKGPVLVEAAGGVMSPLNETETMADLGVMLGAPAIFLAGSYLGAISHALTGLAVLKARGLSTPLVLVNETPDSTVDLHETVASLQGHLPGQTILAIPRGADGPVWAEASRILGV